MRKTVSEQLAVEFKRTADNLKAPVADLVGNSVEASLEVVGTVTSGIGQILGALVDEGNRLRKRICNALDKAAS